MYGVLPHILPSSLHKQKLPFKTPCIIVLLDAENYTDAWNSNGSGACLVPSTSRNPQFIRLIRRSLAILHPDGQQNIVAIILFDPCFSYCIELPCAPLVVLFFTEIISL